MPPKLTPKLANKIPGITPMDPGEQQLRDLWNKPQLDDQVKTPGGTTGIPKHAPQFRPDPTVVGPQHLALLAEYYMKLAPELKAKVHDIILGPNSRTIGVMEPEYPVEAYPRTNILGHTSPTMPARISINPRLEYEDDQSFYPETFAHELTHAAGYRSEGDGSQVDVAEKASKNPKTLEKFKSLPRRKTKRPDSMSPDQINLRQNIAMRELAAMLAEKK